MGARPDQVDQAVGAGPASVVGIGIDTADVDQVAAALARHGTRYLDHVLSPTEQAEVQADFPEAQRALALATRWAAKEAVTKILAPAPDDPWPWHDLEILDTSTPPALTARLHGRPRELADALGIRHLQITPTTVHEHPHPAVTVTAIALT